MIPYPDPTITEFLSGLGVAVVFVAAFVLAGFLLRKRRNDGD